MKKKIIIAQSILRAVQSGNNLFARGSIAVLPASSTEEILHLHETQKTDLIITETALPSMAPLAFCSALRKDPALKEVSLVMLCEPKDPAGEYRKAGCNEVLTKPVEMTKLFSTVSQMLMVQQRLAARIPVRIRLEGKGKKETFIGLSSDVSASGMLLDTGIVMKTGDRLQCTFSLSSRPITVDAVVVRVQLRTSGKLQYGLKFSMIDAKTFVLIEHFIKSNVRTDDAASRRSQG